MDTDKAKSKCAKKLTDKFLQLRSDALKNGFNDKQIHEVIEGTTPTPAKRQYQKWSKKFQSYLLNPAHRVQVLVVLLAFTVGMFVASYEFVFDFVTTTPCLVENNIISEEVYRPRMNCDMCRDIVNVPEEKDLSPETFYEKYSFTGRPVLVKEATSNWTAMSHFNFSFFRQLYKKVKGSLNTIEEDCPFFGYETEFVSLAEALNMSDDRAAYKPGELPWYIGWSNCHERVGKELRKHYQRPYFLPSDSETVTEDWIFMGGPGLGAAIHLDYVGRPSWQAQISGTKTWQLIPSPECQSVCHAINVTVHKGDVIVLDTNIWYHSTYVHPGELSISIGSEFD